MPAYQPAASTPTHRPALIAHPTSRSTRHSPPQVRTLDGRLAWRRRHYRVRRGATPGTFHLSVLDNGVTSKEYWRILDCAEDLEW